MAADGGKLTAYGDELPFSEILALETPPATDTSGSKKVVISNASTDDAYTGLLLVLGSTVCFSAMSYCVDEIDQEVPVLQTASVRFWAQLGFTLLSIPLSVPSQKLALVETWLGKPENRWKLAMRGSWGIFGLSCFFATIQSLSIADATAVVYVNIPLTALFARIFLKEEYNKIDALAAALAFVGVICVAQPPALFGGDASPVPLPALALALFGSCCSAMAYVSIRLIGRSEDALTVVLWFSILGSIATPILCLLLQEFIPFPMGRTAWLELGTGLFGFAGQVFLNAGMQRAPAAHSAAMRYADILWALLIQGLVQGKPPNGWKYLGCALIMSTLVSTVYKSRHKSLATKKAVALIGAAARVPAHTAPTASSEAHKAEFRCRLEEFRSPTHAS